MTDAKPLSALANATLRCENAPVMETLVKALRAAGLMDGVVFPLVSDADLEKALNDYAAKHSTLDLGGDHS